MTRKGRVYPAREVSLLARCSDAKLGKYLCENVIPEAIELHLVYHNLEGPTEILIKRLWELQPPIN